MANNFVLTAQIALQAPNNTRQVINQIRSQLQGIGVDVKLNTNSGQLKQTANQLNTINKSAQAASTSVSELGKTLGAAARRFGAISLATGTFLSLARSIKSSLGDAVEFERQMVILSQTTEKSTKDLGDFYKEITRLSTGLGVSSDSLVKTSIILAQAGLEARKAKAALEVLAKTQLAASFDDITSTTEGAIAILAQFRKEATSAGGDIKFLEQSLEAINQVSKKYAVESSDLIAVIRRSGGAFEAAGGSLNELLALFTSVRATTRESAETIATGLRTIFTRIQRVDTINQLKDLGITLQDLEGKFVGPFEAIKRISEGLSELDPRDVRFAQIVEELGGFRQIGKVIPLIKQFALAQDALNTAQKSSGSLTKDVETAQTSLANKISKVREEFQALIRKFADSQTFRSIANGALEFASALIRIADAIQPLLPLITSLAAIQIGKGLAGAIKGFAGIQKKNSGGQIHAFASGGMVPGSGNRDTVPAMLSPGEFVIRKASVKKLGAENLAKLNRGGRISEVQKFGKGGAVKSDLLDKKTVGAMILNNGKMSGPDALSITVDKDLLAKKNKDNFKNSKDINLFGGKNSENFTLYRSILKQGESSKTDPMYPQFEQDLEKSAKGAISKVSNDILKTLGVGGDIKLKDPIINQSIKGSLFEEIIRNVSANSGGGSFDSAEELNPQRPFDFIGSVGESLQSLFQGEGVKQKYKDAKYSPDAASIDSFRTKIANQLLLDAPLANKTGLDYAINQFKGKEDVTIGRLREEFGGANKFGLSNDFKPDDFVNWYEKNVGKTLSYRMNPKNPQQAMFSGFAKGGAASDTVPALLTPGEFVVKKATAQKVGYAALDKMNRTGVMHGYASGGVVEMKKGGNTAKAVYQAQRSAERRQATMAREGMLFQDETTAEANFKSGKVGGSQRQAPKTSGEGGQSETRAEGSIMAGTGEIAKKAQLTSKMIMELGQKANELGLSYEQGTVLEKTYLKLRRQGIKKEEALQKSIESATKFTTEKNKKFDKKQPVEKQGRSKLSAEDIDKVAGSFKALAATGASIAILATQFSGLDNATKSALTETIAFATTMGATGIQMLEFGKNIFNTAKGLQNFGPILSKIAGRGIATAATAATGAATSAAGGAAAAAGGGAAASGAGGAVAALLPLIANPIGLAIAAVVAALGGFALYIYFIQAKAKKVAEELRKQADAIAENIEKGKAGDPNEYVNLQVKAAKTITDSYLTLGGTLDALGITSAKARQQEIEGIRSAARGYINLVSSIAKFDKQLAEINLDKTLTPLESVIKRIQLLAGAGKEQRSSQNITAQITKLAQKEGVTASFNQLSEESFSNTNAKTEFKLLKDQLKNSIDALEKRNEDIRQNIQTAIEESIKTTDFGQAATKDLNLDGVIDSYDTVIQQNKGFADAIALAKEEILRNASFQAGELRQQGKSTEAAQVEKSAKEQVKNMEELSKKQAIAAERAQRSAIATEKAIQANYVMNTALRSTTSYLNDLGAKVQDLGNQFAVVSSIVDNELTSFEIPEIKGLEDLGNIKDVNTFKKEIGALSTSIGSPEIINIGQQLTSGAELIKRAKEELSGVNFAQISGGEGGGVKEAMKRAFGEGGSQLKAIFGDQIGSQLAMSVQAELEKAIEVSSPGMGKIDSQELEKIMDSIVQVMEPSSEFFKAYNEKLAAFVTQYDEISKKLLEVEKERVDGAEKSVQILNRGAQRMEEATGIKGKVSSQTKEARRKSETNARLAATGIAPIAGNVDAIFNQLQATRSTKQLAGETLKKNPTDIKAKDAERKLTLQANELTTALQRLADQSDRAADVMGEIEKERGKREFGKKVMEEFVIGGIEDRQKTMRSFAGAQQVLATGTFQGLGEEDRKSAAGLLDQLANVDDRFKEVKEQIVAQDFTRLGFPPEIAQMLATATPKEQQLLEELSQINAEEFIAQEKLNQIMVDNQNLVANGLANVASSIEKLPKEIAAEMVKNKAAAEQQQQQNAKLETQSAIKNQKMKEAAAPVIQAQQAVKQAEAVVEEKRQNVQTITGNLENMQNRSATLSATNRDWTGYGYDALGTMSSLVNTPLNTVGLPGILPGSQNQRDADLQQVQKDYMAEYERLKPADAQLAQAEQILARAKEQERIATEAMKVQNEQIQNAPAFAGGGVVPGRGSKDSVLAWLTPGETVVPRETTKKIEKQKGMQLYPSATPEQDFFNNAERQKQIKAQDEKIAAIKAQGENYREQGNIAKMEFGKSIASEYESIQGGLYTAPDEPKAAYKGNVLRAPKTPGAIYSWANAKKSSVTGAPAIGGTAEQVAANQKRIRDLQMKEGMGAVYNNPMSNMLGMMNQSATPGLNAGQQRIQNIKGQQANMSGNVYNPAMGTAGTGAATQVGAGGVGASAVQPGNFEAVMKGFQDFSDKITTAATMLSGLKMEHTLTVSGDLSINTETASQAIQESLGKWVTGKVTELINARLGGNKGLQAAGTDSKT